MVAFVVVGFRGPFQLEGLLLTLEARHPYALMQSPQNRQGLSILGERRKRRRRSPAPQTNHNKGMLIPLCLCLYQPTSCQCRLASWALTVLGVAKLDPLPGHSRSWDLVSHPGGSSREMRLSPSSPSKESAHSRGTHPGQWA